MAGEPTGPRGESAGAHRAFVTAASTTKCSKGLPVPPRARQDASAASSGGCPVVGNTEEGSSLSSERRTSTIPTATSDLPEHQGGAQDRWMYPSEKQFYAAMKRKGWSPKEQDMGTVVQIHNTVNERAWREILHWESLHMSDCGGPKLKRFQGRPRDWSPKARILNFLGYKLPFDRHDWIIDRCGQEVRYIIDFYNAAPLPTMPVAMFLDVRPALDSFEALWDRIRMQAKWIGSGRWRRE